MERESIHMYFAKKKTVPSENHVESLLSHPRTSKIRFDRKKKKFVYDGRMVDGLTRPIRNAFFPDYYGIKRRRNGRSSVEVGTRVHRQIHHVIRCEGRWNDSPRTCDCEIKTNPRRLHKYTKKLLATLDLLNLTPFASEVPVFSSIANACTQLDVVCYRWRKDPDKRRSVVISLKTGYASGHDRSPSGETMRGALSGVESCPKNHNQVQGACERFLLKEEYGIEFDDYFIVYLGHGRDGNGVLIENLTHWATNDETCGSILREIGGRK